MLCDDCESGRRDQLENKTLRHTDQGENSEFQISENISGSRDQWLSAKSTVSPVASSVRIQIQNLTLFLGGSRSGVEGPLFIVDVVVEYVQWNLRSYH